MARIIGIDLGTTNSLVAYVEDRTGLPRIIPDPEGGRLLPSVVAFAPEGILVGEPARRQLVRRPESTVYSVKRFMGRGSKDARRDAQRSHYRLAEGDEGLVRFVTGAGELSPVEVSADILRVLRQRAVADEAGRGAMAASLRPGVEVSEAIPAKAARTVHRCGRSAHGTSRSQAGSQSA